MKRRFREWLLRQQYFEQNPDMTEDSLELPTVKARRQQYCRATVINSTVQPQLLTVLYSCTVMNSTVQLYSYEQYCTAVQL